MGVREYLRGPRLQWALALTGAVAWILQGYDSALMNGLLTLPSFEQTFPQIDTSTASKKASHAVLQGTVVALFEVGAAVGGVICYFIGDRLGRRRTTIAACWTILVGTVLQSSAFQLAQLSVGRLFTGFGLGMVTATVPTWIGESSDAERRGLFILLEGAGAAFGGMVVAWIELGLFFVKSSSVSWRFPTALQALVPIFVLTMTPLLNESPRWLISHERLQEARSVLARLTNEEEDSELVASRIQIIEQSLANDRKTERSNAPHPFSRTPNRHLHRTILAIAINIMGKMAGSTVVYFYSTAILQGTLGFSAVNARIVTGCLQIWHFFWDIVALWLVDRIGRRPLLLVSAVLMAISLAGLAGLSSIPHNTAAAGASLLFFFLVSAAFPIGLFLVPFMYASEIAPLDIRTQVTAMASTANWLTDFLVAEISPIAFANIGWRYYLVFAAVNTFSTLAFYLFYPETKGRTLEDIDGFFLGATDILQPVRLAKTLREGIAEEIIEKDEEKADAKAQHADRAVL